MISQDFKQRVKVAGLFLLQIYKVTTGTMLSLFVPQACSSSDGSSDNESRICTLQENFDNSDEYHEMVLYVNMFSMFTFFTYYLVELRREEWAIKYLDIDNDKPDNSLKGIIRADPLLDKNMDKLNLLYYRSLIFNCGIYAINLGLSAKLVKDDYHSSSTLSCFISFSLLVLMKLYNSLEVAHQSVTNDKMTSAYMSEFVSFNVLDSDYIDEQIKLKMNNEIKLEEITLEDGKENEKDKEKDNENILPNP